MTARASARARQGVLGFAALVVLALAAACGPAESERTTAGSDRATPATANAIKGVWAFVSETDTETGVRVRDDTTWSGVWVFTDRYHCLARMENNRSSLPEATLESLSAADLRKHYEQLLRYSSTAGTYTLEGQTLRRRWTISLGPDIIGQESVATAAVEGDRLIVDLPRRTKDSGPAVRVVYRRLE